MAIMLSSIRTPIVHVKQIISAFLGGKVWIFCGLHVLGGKKPPCRPQKQGAGDCRKCGLQQFFEVGNQLVGANGRRPGF